MTQSIALKLTRLNRPDNRDEERIKINGFKISLCYANEFQPWVNDGYSTHLWVADGCLTIIFPAKPTALEIFSRQISIFGLPTATRPFFPAKKFRDKYSSNFGLPTGNLTIFSSFPPNIHLWVADGYLTIFSGFPPNIHLWVADGYSTIFPPNIHLWVADGSSTIFSRQKNQGQTLFELWVADGCLTIFSRQTHNPN